MHARKLLSAGKGIAHTATPCDTEIARVLGMQSIKAAKQLSEPPVSLLMQQFASNTCIALQLSEKLNHKQPVCSFATDHTLWFSFNSWH